MPLEVHPGGRYRADPMLSAMPFLRRCLPLFAALALTACHGQTKRATGDACHDNTDCASALCLPYTDGYCTSDCSKTACATGEICRQTGGFSFCFQPCTGAMDCRSGYQCFQGACVAACQRDADCGKGYGCTQGVCTELPGAPLGSACKEDTDCASRDCDPNTSTCKKGCASESDCASGETCWKNPVDTDDDGYTDAVHPVCAPRRDEATAAPDAACESDDDCVQGQCNLGRCVLFCETPADCPSADDGCYGQYTDTDNGLVAMGKGCLLAQGTIELDLPDGTDSLGLPENVVSATLFAAAKNYDTSYYTGFADLYDPQGNELFDLSNQSDFYDFPLRYVPSEGTSTLLISSSPEEAPIQSGVYTFSPFAQKWTSGASGQMSIKLRLKLGEAVPTKGHVNLHVFFPDLTGGCWEDGQNVPPLSAHVAQTATTFRNFEKTFRQIYAQVGVTIDNITYTDIPGPADITVPQDGGPSATMDALLQAATAGDDPDTLQFIVVRNIFTMPATQGGMILGIAGGIPASPGIPGTPHSGAVVAEAAVCGGGAATTLALTAAHELGHTLGLFHSAEQDGNLDQLSDTSDGLAPYGCIHGGPSWYCPPGETANDNLMYWEEGGGSVLSPLQGQVIRVNPTIHND